MHEFDCERCGIHVVDIVGQPHPEKIYCLHCRFLESLDSESEKEQASKVIGMAYPPESGDNHAEH